MKFCSNCGAPLSKRIPRDDNRVRFVCDVCKTVHYQNPTMVVGSIPEYRGRILLCRRAIEPRYGKWTLPAGYLENNETMAQGAGRETLEESGAQVIILEPYALFNLTFVSQVYLMFLARMTSPVLKPGEESLEAKLFTEQEIPWDELAFTVIRETLRLYFKDLPTGRFPFHTGDIHPDNPGGL